MTTPGVLAASLAKRAPGYTSLGLPDPRAATSRSRHRDCADVEDGAVAATSSGWTHIRYSACMGSPGPSTEHAIRAWASSLLQQARIISGLSQRDLSTAAGVPRSTIARIESGQMQPTLPTLQRILIATGVEMRIRLEPYDDHDDVLDALAAADPDRARRARSGVDELATRLTPLP